MVKSECLNQELFLILSFMLFTKEKNGSEYVIDFVEDKTESYWFSDDDYNEWTEDFVVQIPYGFLLMPKDYTSKDVVVDSEGNLFIGGKIVYDYITTCKRLSDMKGRIPAYYCIRTEQGSDERPFLGFECGFDLLQYRKKGCIDLCSPKQQIHSNLVGHGGCLNGQQNSQNTRDS
jgi:hypothetical protein